MQTTTEHQEFAPWRTQPTPPNAWLVQTLDALIEEQAEFPSTAPRAWLSSREVELMFEIASLTELIEDGKAMRLQAFENAVRSAVTPMTLTEFRNSPFTIQDLQPSVLQEEAVFQLRLQLWLGADLFALCRVATKYGIRVAVDHTHAGRHKQGPDRYTLIF